jgi:DNA-binding transcriptional LysR family regulator
MRLHNLALNLLVMLDTLLTERSVSETAQQMRLTQPAISNALSRLRQHFQDELLVQIGRKMVPTPFAESLSVPVHQALAELQRIATMRGSFDPATADRTFAIICSDFSFQMFLTHAIRELVQIAPNVHLMTFLTGDQAAELLNQGIADFCVNPSARMVPDQPGIPLFSEGFSCIVWDQNTLVGETLSREEFCSLGHVSTCLGPTNPSHMEQSSLDAQGLRRNIVVYAPNFTSVAEAVVGTNLLATVHTRTAAVYAQRLPLRIVKPPVVIEPFVEHLQWHRNKTADPGMVWMRDFLVRIAATI